MSSFGEISLSVSDFKQEKVQDKERKSNKSEMERIMGKERDREMSYSVCMSTIKFFCLGALDVGVIGPVQPAFPSTRVQTHLATQ